MARGPQTPICAFSPGTFVCLKWDLHNYFNEGMVKQAWTFYQHASSCVSQGDQTPVYWKLLKFYPLGALTLGLLSNY